MSITGPEEGGLFRAGVSFQNMGIDPFDPKDHDSYFSFQITGPDGKRVMAGAFRAPVYRTDRVEDGYTVEFLHMVGSVQLNLR